MRVLIALLAFILCGTIACGTDGYGRFPPGTECNQTDSTATCCLKKHPGDSERCGLEKPPERMLGERGTQMPSKTLWRNGRARLDVENPAPGQRPGQLHYQEGTAKYLYDPSTRSFVGAPQRVNALLREDPKFAAAVEKALRYLGE
jgi:hypothetical protein